MISRLLRLTAFSLFFVLGLLLLFEFFSFDNWKALGAFVNGLSGKPQSRTWLGLAAIIFLLIPLVALFLWNKHRLRLCRYRIPATPEPVYIRLEAISGFVSGVAREYEAVLDAAADIRKSGPGIDIRLRVSLFTEQNMLMVTETLRERIRNAVRDQLGIPEIDRISIVTTTITDTRLL